MSDAAISAAPRHPQIDRRSLIAWPGYHSGLSVSSFDRRIVGAIAKPLAHVVHDSALVAGALKAGMGVVLPAQGWRNQLPLDHPKRAGGFSMLSVHRPDLVLVPDQGRMRAAFAERYAADDLGGQLAAGATIATTPGHVLEVEGREGRRNELLLARLVAEDFMDRRAFSPAPGQTGLRELYATIIVQGAHAAEPAIIDWLIAAYADLEGVTGYWIVAVNTNKSGKQDSGYVRLALRLQDLTGRSSVTSCIGDAHFAMLGSGVAATCAGLHGMNFRHPPEELPDLDDEEDEIGLGVHIYHPAVLGNAGQLGIEGDGLRKALFLNHPCACGHHPAHEPPRGKRQIVAHNSFAIQSDARDFALPEVVVAEVRLAARAERAQRQRSMLQMTRLRTGFRAIPLEAARLREEAATAGADESD
jgi:hypothetical protein